MKQSISWQQRRVQMLKEHLQQRKDLLASFNQVKAALGQVHQTERDQLGVTTFPASFPPIYLHARQAAEQQHLVNAFVDFNRAMLQRQAWEERALAQQIEQERIRQQ